MISDSKRRTLGRLALVLGVLFGMTAGAANMVTATARPLSVMSAPQAHTEARSGKRLLIDVRSPREWQQTGVAQHAHTISIHRDGGLTTFLAAVNRLTKGQKDAPIALICASGVRSNRAMRYLRQNGYTNVRNVSEGMMGHGLFSSDKPGWLKRRLPIRPCTSCR